MGVRGQGRVDVVVVGVTDVVVAVLVAVPSGGDLASTKVKLAFVPLMTTTLAPTQRHTPPTAMAPRTMRVLWAGLRCVTTAPRTGIAEV
jgi:hypothetical protein